MAKYKVTFDREACIGAFSCIGMHPDRWIMSDDSKVDLEGAPEGKKVAVQTLEIDEDEFEEMMDSAESCPVKVIHIKNMETGEELI